MKKRLLITSIVMMLVVAVALSTATYAWFTSSTTVTSSSISMTAATNDAASLGISWTEGNYGSQITAYSPNDGSAVFKPACPTELVANTTTLGAVDDSGTTEVNEAAHNVVFNTAFATPGTGESEGDMVFLANGAPTDIYTWTDDSSSTHSNFYVANLSPSNVISSITVKATITDTNNLVRVAVFVYDDTKECYVLKGVMANKETSTYSAVPNSAAMNDGSATTDSSEDDVVYYKKYLGKYVVATAGTAAQVNDGFADYENGVTVNDGKFFTREETASYAKAAYGPIAQNASVNAMTSIDTADATVGVQIATNLAAEHAINVKILVWEDAVALGDAQHGAQSSVALTFLAA